MEKHLIKMIMSTGQVLALYADDGALDELTAHPKFLRMKDEGNYVYMSIENVAAFEIVSDRKEPPKPVETDETKNQEAQGLEQA